jgi:hypothetical protein
VGSGLLVERERIRSRHRCEDPGSTAGKGMRGVVEVLALRGRGGVIRV